MAVRRACSSGVERRRTGQTAGELREKSGPCGTPVEPDNRVARMARREVASQMRSERVPGNSTIQEGAGKSEVANAADEVYQNRINCGMKLDENCQNLHTDPQFLPDPQFLLPPSFSTLFNLP